jgi:hypothetical protein
MDKLLENSPWPLALVIIAVSFFFIFRPQISAAINRFRGASFGNKSVDMRGDQAAVEKQKQMEGPMGTAAAVAPDTIPASHMMPPPSDVYAPIEQQIRAALIEAKYPNDLEKAWLIRSLAASACAAII